MPPIPPWMIATGVLGAGAVGVAAYALSTQKSGPVGPPPVVKPAIPTLPGVQRPQSVTGALTAVFGTTPLFSLIGPVVVVSAGATIPVTPVLGGYLILVLPTNATWTGAGAIYTGSGSAAGKAIGQVNFAGDMTSPIAIPTASLSGSNELFIGFKDSSGDQQALVTYPLAYYPAAPV
jgi:hypothetical protein